MLGLPSAFASHFAPEALMQALRSLFQPSEQLQEPYAMVGVNVFAADTDAEARRSDHIAATAVRQPATRHARAFAAAGRQHGRLLVAHGAGRS
jgi:alkanesulfonate monooxygenase SsuD/methylene tetrahydromethanopterin reductase-like flavin-dependent oxidoreductase (luciferase family)